jgi:UDP-galactopyranose mutase
MKYDYLIVGSGLYGITSARLLTNAGYKCLIIEQRDKLGGILLMKILMEYWYILMDLTYFIQIQMRYGNL